MQWLFVFVLFPSLVYASENCVSQYKGQCRGKCAAGEVAAEGAFIDCAEKEECCVTSETDKNKDTEGRGDVRKEAGKPRDRRL